MAPFPDVPERLAQVSELVSRAGHDAAILAAKLLPVVTESAGNDAVRALKAEVGCHDDGVERLLLWHAALQATEAVPGLPVDASVKTRLLQDLAALHSARQGVDAGSYAFIRAARMATLRRFPAGPMEWEISGIPRSYLLRARFPVGLRLAGYLAARLHFRRAPFFFMHVAPAPRNRGLSVPKEVMRSYYRMVNSLRMQPEMQGLIAEAWFHDPQALQANPQLAALNEPYFLHGGAIFPLDLADVDGGVAVGNQSRADAYREGDVRYYQTLAVWPRDAAIKWASSHPEFGEGAAVNSEIK